MAECEVVSECAPSSQSGPGCCYLCNQCPAAFSSLPDLESHLQSHTESGDTSKLVNGGEPEVEEEEEEAHSPASLSIYSDSMAYDDSNKGVEDDIDMDEGEDSPDKSATGRLFSCRFCSKLFQSRSQLNIHYTHTHRDKPQYECEHCGKIFSVKRELATHRRIHSGEQTHCCTQCGKEFGTRQLLKKHWMWHTGQRSHVCPHCSKAFFQKGHLTQHLMIHAGGRPHVCNLCSKTFIFKFDLNRHMKIHAERGFNCAKCAKSFIKQSTLVDHEAQCDGPGKSDVVEAKDEETISFNPVENPPTMAHVKRLSTATIEPDLPKPTKQRVLCIFCMQDFVSQAAYAVHFSLVHCRQAANMISQQQALALAGNVSNLYTTPPNFGQPNEPPSTSPSAASASQPCTINSNPQFNFSQPPAIKLESPTGAEIRGASDDDSESSPIKCASSENGSSEGRGSSTQSDTGHYCSECNCANPKLGLAMQRLTQLQRVLALKEGELDRLKEQMNRVGYVAGGLLESCSEFDKLWMLHSKKVYSQIQAVLHGLE